MKTKSDNNRQYKSQAVAQTENSRSLDTAQFQIGEFGARSRKIANLNLHGGEVPPQLRENLGLGINTLQTQRFSKPNPQSRFRSAQEKTTSLQGQTDAPIQRIVVNTGGTSLTEELSGRNGWIIASDIQVALEDGGWTQQICERSQLQGKIAADENIYLVGHGREGLLGLTEAAALAPELNGIIPEGYTGQIRSLNCSSGVGNVSAVEELAEQMVKKTIVQGAAGIALNHSSYPGGSRTIPENKWNQAEPIVNQHIEAVHQKWEQYVQATGIIPSLFKLDAVFADLISDTFYRELEVELESKRLLLPKGQDITIK